MTTPRRMASVAIVVVATLATLGGAHAGTRHNIGAPGFPPLDPLGSLGSELLPGKIMDESHYLQSANNQHVLLNDGSAGEDLALLLTGPTCTPTPLATGPESLTATYTLDMQSDGNLVLRDRATTPATVRFHTGTAGNPGAKAVLQDDRNLVVYSTTGTALWNSGTACTTITGFVAADNTPTFPNRNSGSLASGQYLHNQNRTHRLVMQSDGNLVLYHGTTPRFATATHGNPGATATLQSDGNLVVRSTTGTALWNSGTPTSPPVHATLTLHTTGQLTITRNTLTTNHTHTIAS